MDTFKIKLSPQEASVLYSLGIKIEILCEDGIGDSEVLHKKLELFSQNRGFVKSKGYDGKGKPHNGVNTPHIHDYKSGITRKPTQNEMPKGNTK